MTMVDIKTLRIGSHVLMNGVRAKVMRLNTVKYSETETFHILVRGVSPDTGAVGECGCFADDKAVQPIPITPALLEELGFNKGMSSAIGFDSWYCDMMRIDNNVMQAHPWWFYNQVKLRYLHELESLYYMLRRVELIKE
nr:MAG TPA: hypothetical protein [Caudoviricetes sp.]